MERKRDPARRAGRRSASGELGWATTAPPVPARPQQLRWHRLHLRLASPPAPVHLEPLASSANAMGAFLSGLAGGAGECRPAARASASCPPMLAQHTPGGRHDD
jgi:hypothetical protein